MERRLSELKPHLEAVFEAFYRKLLSDAHFSVFFRDDAHVRSLIRRQRRNLEAALGDSPERLKERYVALGRFHREIFVPYPDFALGVDFLAEQIFTIIARDPALSRSAGDLFGLFMRIKNYTAKGYLQSMLEADRRDIDAFIQNLRRSREAVSELMESHLVWLRQVLTAIEKEDEELMPELHLENSDFYHWLLSDEAELYIPDADDRAHLFDFHRRILTDANNLFYFVKHEYYTELLSIYTNINKQLLTLNNIATVMFTRSKMEELARDALTGLYSRKTLDDSLTHAVRLSQLTKRPLSVIIADIDDFKTVNDSFGHAVGDCVLRETAEVIRRYLRSSDDAFRYGGEEFFMLLHDTELSGACKLAEKVRRTIENTRFECGGGELRITMSFGVAAVEAGQTLSVADLFAEADKHLYRSKQAGKNTIRA